MKRRAVLVELLLAAALGATVEAAAQAKDLEVRHCQSADSLLRVRSGAFNGKVIAMHDEAFGTTRILTGRGSSPPRITASALVDSVPWSGVPPVQITAYLRGREVESLVGLGRQPRVALVVNDTVAEDLGVGTLGTFVGPATVPKRLITIPVSALIGPTTLLAIARARSAALRVEGVTVSVPTVELRNLAALYVVLTCGSSSQPVSR